jgi:hypothetical protein
VTLAGGETLTSSKLQSGTAQASTSGTSIDFTGIPSWAKRITVMFNGVSTLGVSNPLIQIGDSGGIENTGYLGASNNTSSSANYTTGFGINGVLATNILHGSMTLSLLDISNNLWVASGVVGASSSAFTATITGSKSLSATLDRVRITTVLGDAGNAFDAGSINIMWE